MKTALPEQYRLENPEVANRLRIPAIYCSDQSFGANGIFLIPFKQVILKCFISDGGGWDHVSVSLKNRCPTWEEMCFIKDLFFEPEETAFQYHPKHSEYVDHHPFCLHIWKPNQGQPLATPPSIMVGPASAIKA